VLLEGEDRYGDLTVIEEDYITTTSSGMYCHTTHHQAYDGKPFPVVIFK
jgi:hypothetical protein